MRIFNALDERRQENTNLTEDVGCQSYGSRKDLSKSCAIESHVAYRAEIKTRKPICMMHC